MELCTRSEKQKYAVGGRLARVSASGILCSWFDATVVDITEKLTECRDPKDNKFLELAVSGNATSIVSGDRDLLVFSPFRAVMILTPQKFISGS